MWHIICRVCAEKVCFDMFELLSSVLRGFLEIVLRVVFVFPIKLKCRLFYLDLVTRFRVMKRLTGGLKVLGLVKLICVLDVTLPALSL